MPRKKTTTQAQERKRASLAAQLDKARSDVFHAAGDDPDLRFSEAMAIVDAATRDAYETAREALYAYERQLEREGRGWRQGTSFYAY